jgi:formylglycine-generating enzyme
VSGNRFTVLMAALVLAVTASAARAEVNIDFVTVGNAGNAADTRYDATGFGAVDRVYQIGRYEVTASQYTAFLNAVATTDTYELYNESMWTHDYGCKIQRSGSSGSYKYSVADDRANRPVNYVSFWDAARFVNWLHNGQGNGDTESGAYVNIGYWDKFTRSADARYWIPTENEWYKAAYHKNDGVTDNYWDYPTGSNSKPSNKLSPDISNNANFDDNGYTVGSPYYMTPVGAFENSASPYGTFDQGGNVWEWNEAFFRGERGLRGGSWYRNYDYLLASARANNPSNYECSTIGFRLASVPEPGSFTLILCGALAGLLCWRRRLR